MALDSAQETPTPDSSHEDHDEGLVVIAPATLTEADLERRIQCYVFYEVQSKTL
jgi:hypothetical protein